MKTSTWTNLSSCCTTWSWTQSVLLGKKFVSPVLFNFVYFFRLFRVCFFLYLLHQQCNCSWQLNFCLNTGNEPFSCFFSSNQNDITCHCRNTFNQFSYFLQFAFNFDVRLSSSYTLAPYPIRECVSSFWFWIRFEFVWFLFFVILLR